MSQPEEAGLDIDYDAELAGIQGAVAGLQEQQPDETVVIDTGELLAAQSVELKGRRFKIADSVGLMPMLKFARFADLSTTDPRAMVAMYQLLQDCIHPDDWAAFEEHAIESKAEGDDLFDCMNKALELIAGRPTKPAGTSSPGRRAISGASTARSSARRGRGSRR